MSSPPASEPRPAGADRGDADRDHGDGAGGDRAPRLLGYWLLWGALLLALLWRGPAPTELVWEPTEPTAAQSIDCNRADWQTLTLIDGIGETLARRIVAARDEQGEFPDLEAVMAVRGVPDAPLRRARHWLLPPLSSERPSSERQPSERQSSERPSSERKR